MARLSLVRGFASNPNGAQTQIKKSTGATLTRPDKKLQFSKERLTDFGELPRGEIPEGLQVSPVSTTTTLSNGVTVATEIYGTPLVTIGFHWKYGSRHETQETSGATHFIQNLRFRGNEKLNRGELEKKLQAVGGSIQQDLDRERNSLYVTVLKDDVAKVFDLMSGAITSTNLNENQLEAEREIVYRRIVDLQKDMMECTLENALYTSFRDHQMGQPVLGNRETAQSLTVNQLKDFIAQHHTGSNLIVTATGPVNHNQIVDLSGKHFGELQRASSSTPANLNKPYFTPSLIFMHDDEMVNVNAGVFFRAPGYADPEAYMMRLFVELLGEYRADKHTGTNLNDPSRQYNEYHAHIGHYPDLSLQKTLYFPYSDVGLIGSYVLGNEVFGPQVMFSSQVFMSRFANDLLQSEIFRARARVFYNLLNQTSSVQTNRDLAMDIQYLNRRVSRTEAATRISAGADYDVIRHTAKKWFYDVDISAAVWGPTHYIDSHGHYNRPWKRSTLGQWYTHVGSVI